MAKLKYNISTSKSAGDVKHLYISFETDDGSQVGLCKAFIEDFANDFKERFINVPVSLVEIPEDVSRY